MSQEGTYTMEELRSIYKRQGITHYEIVVEEDGVTCLWGFGSYPKGSVLEGQHRQARIHMYNTLEEARKCLPEEIPVKDDGRRPPTAEEMGVGLGPNAPDWFDPADAGERWDEDY
jgi:hypothetical protein